MDWQDAGRVEESWEARGGSWWRPHGPPDYGIGEGEGEGRKSTNHPMGDCQVTCKISAQYMQNWQRYGNIIGRTDRRLDGRTDVETLLY